MNKVDLKQIEALLKNFATKDDLHTLATKDDLQQLKKGLVSYIGDVEMNIIAVVEKYKADKDQVNNLEKRVRHIEDQLSST